MLYFRTTYSYFTNFRTLPFFSAEIKKHSSLQLKFQGNFARQYQDRQNHDDRPIHSLEYRNLPSYRR